MPNDTSDLAVTTQGNGIVEIKAGLIVACCTSYKKWHKLYDTQRGTDWIGANIARVHIHKYLEVLMKHSICYLG